jgi:RNA polymerase sigma factor (sigma-70 family)
MLASYQTGRGSHEGADLRCVVQQSSSGCQLRSQTLETTLDLIAKVREGDETACEILINRYWRPLKQFAHNRLPKYVRSMTDPDDIVQDALMNTFQRLRHFDCRHGGSLLAYLRQAVSNRIVDEMRRSSRSCATVPVPDSQAALTPSPLAFVLRKESATRYRAALLRLRARDRTLMVLRIQEGLSYSDIAQRLHMTTSDAVRTACARAMLRLASALKDV